MQQIKAYLSRWAAARRARRVTLDNARRRVYRGAAYLDDVAPGWHREVDADTLALSSGGSCVLGQLHGDFRVGLVRAHLLNLSSAPRASLSPVAFGFQCVSGVNEAVQARDYAFLDEVWREAVRERQKSEESVPLPPGRLRTPRQAAEPIRERTPRRPAEPAAAEPAAA